MKRRQDLSKFAVVETLEAFAKAGLVRKVSLPVLRETVVRTAPEQDDTRRNNVAVVPAAAQRYNPLRDMRRIPLDLASGISIRISAGGQNVLIKKIVNQFCPRFTPGGKPVYVGDTNKKWAYFDPDYLQSLGLAIEEHGKMPDVVVHFRKQNWLVLIETATSHGPVSPKRLTELKNLFADSKARLVFVTAFLDRKRLRKYLDEIAWETEVWMADAPDHMIHFNGERFLGPY